MSTRTFVVAAAWVGSLAACFAVARAQPEQVIERVIERPAPAVRCGVSADEVRRIVADSVARPTPAAEAEPEPEPEPSARDDDSAARAEALLVAGLADGRWTTQEREDFQRALGSVPRERASELLGTFSGAINAGHVRLEFDE